MLLQHPWIAARSIARPEVAYLPIIGFVANPQAALLRSPISSRSNPGDFQENGPGYISKGFFVVAPLTHCRVSKLQVS
jgi:hypothetical protein